MNIVFLVHYFPPLNSTGARRVLAFSKYLHRLGHRVTVLSTVKTKKDGALSESVPEECELIELAFFKKKTSIPRSKNEDAPKKRTLLGRLLTRFKRFMMTYWGQILDHRLFFALNLLNPFLDVRAKNALEQADVIISSCPPWPLHLAGVIAKKRFKKRWIADYRDQFSGNHFFPGNFFTRFLEHRLEKWMLKFADGVLAISEPMQEYYQAFHSNVFCISNGYDAELFRQAEMALKENEVKASGKVIRYMGTLSAERVPSVFLEALRALDTAFREKLTVEFYGERNIAEVLIKRDFPDLIHLISFKGIVPYREAIRLMLEADALLFQETSPQKVANTHSARGTLTTKLFEYLASKKPIIAEVSPTSLMAELIFESGLCLVSTLDMKEMKEGIFAWLQNDAFVSPNEMKIIQHSREAKTKMLVEVIEAIAE